MFVHSCIDTVSVIYTAIIRVFWRHRSCSAHNSFCYPRDAS